MLRNFHLILWARLTDSLIMLKGLAGMSDSTTPRIEGTDHETAFTPILEAMKQVRSQQGEILTKPFLDLCKMILPVLDKFGTSLSPVKSDVGGNINRLSIVYESNPTKFNFLHSVVQPEIEAKTAKSSSSCTNALLWLTRAMDFLIAVFQNMLDHPEWGMSQVVMKLAPDRKKFVEVIGRGNEDLNIQMKEFCTRFSPFLRENHKFLVRVGMDNL
ncbi:unnamed protein product [Linum tenue]|uniref:Glycolipid transfer protein domain-containing protein n=1 Tax=Linum tenue TaxID=586396 RepID=A0AAV0LJW8_9ROSI|nr:unnamed protein product [Linum tenue]